jgi:hypothetical protein
MVCPHFPTLVSAPGFVQIKEKENVSGKWEMGFVYWRKLT